MRTAALGIALASCATRRPGSTYSREPNASCLIEERSTTVVADRSTVAAPSAEFVPEVTPDPEFRSALPESTRAATLPLAGSEFEHPMNRPAVFWIARLSSSHSHVACVRADRVPRSMRPSTSLVVRFSNGSDDVIRDGIDVDWDSLRDGRPLGPRWELHRGTAFSLLARHRSLGSNDVERNVLTPRSTPRWTGNRDGAVTFCPRIVLSLGAWEIALDRWFWTLADCDRAVSRSS